MVEDSRVTARPTFAGGLTPGKGGGSYDICSSFSII